MKGILRLISLPIQMCVPKSLKLKPLDGQKLPDSAKLKQAVGLSFVVMKTSFAIAILVSDEDHGDES